MSKLSGIRDVDREILSKVDDKELLKACSIDKYTWKNVCDDAFLRRRLLSKYPEIEAFTLYTSIGSIVTLEYTASTNSFRIGVVVSRFSEHENNPIKPANNKKYFIKNYCSQS